MEMGVHRSDLKPMKGWKPNLSYLRSIILAPAASPLMLLQGTQAQVIRML